jgi:hypothetical protein
MELQLQGNIAVKALPIRLLALCTVVREGSVRLWPSIADGAHAALHNTRRLTALSRGGIGRLQRTARQGTIGGEELASQVSTKGSRVCRNHIARRK